MVSILCKYHPLFKPSASISNPVNRGLSSLKESYVYHPKKETLEADVQALLWTKTQTLDRFPQPFLEVRNSLKLERFLPLVAPTILASRVYERQEVKMKYKNKPRDLTKGTHKNFPISLMFNLFRMALCRSSDYPQLRNLSISLKPFIAASWPCVGDTMSVRGKVDMVINSRQPLSRMYNTDTIQNSTSYDFKSLGNPLTFVDLKKYPMNSSFSTGSNSPSTQTHYPHAHTLVVLDNGDYMEPPSKGVPEIQLLQKGIVFTFSRLYSQAVGRYGNEIIGTELPAPECAQCIVTNGHRFAFIWYQLNTLNTSNLDEGIKNQLFVSRGNLYSNIEPDGVFKKTVAGLDKEVLRTLISMFIA